MKKHWFHVLLLLIIAAPLHAQLPSTPPPRGMMHPSVVSRHFALTIPLPLRTPLYPPLQSSMPLDVMLGYIYFDSIVRSVDLLHGQFDSAAVFATNSDTLRNGLKYLYKMSDWDPITLFEYKENAPIMSGLNSGPYKNC